MVAKFLFGLVVWASPVFAFAQGAAVTGANPVRPVPFVDLDRYSGIWYDIGSFPQRFQRGCHCTRARYSKNEDGTINVVNSCNRDSISGRLTVAEGTAVVVPEAVQDGSWSRLKVYFFLPWLRWFGGDYWIIGLDEDYRWAVVSEPSRKYLWILSRTPVLQAAELERAKKAIVDNGLDIAGIQWTPQAGCQYPE